LADPPHNNRRTAIADAAIEVLGSFGSRGLSHRAVDRHLGLPEGSASHYYPTRKALLGAAMQRMVEQSLAQSEVRALKPKTPREAARALAATVDRVVAPAGRNYMVAYFELVLEARRDEELQTLGRELRQRYIDETVRVLREAGAADPERNGKPLAVFLNALVLRRLTAPEDPLPTDEAAHQIQRFFDEA
jgi:DNA-binding transcriptional regulator YbjK